MPLILQAQSKLIRENRQKEFHQLVPPGNYSGITPLEDGTYAVINDKSDSAFWSRFRVDIDTITGDIRQVAFLGDGKYTQERNLDGEGIARVGKQLYLTSETHDRIQNYPLEDGDSTFQSHTYFFRGARGNYGLESLTWDESRKWLWTATESTPKHDGEAATSLNGVRNHLPLVALNDTLGEVCRMWYEMDPPSVQEEARNYAMGVSALCALPNGRLLVLERELFVPHRLIGAFVVNKIYEVDPDEKTQKRYLAKQLVAAWKTKLGILDRSFANYEGMCMGPKTKDGNQVIILVADSQNQYKGVLKDWFKTLVISY